MENLNIRGIVRATSPQGNADGNCGELINLRPSQGVWKAVGPKEAVMDNIGYVQVYTHQYGPFENLIVVAPYRDDPYDPEGGSYSVMWAKSGSSLNHKFLCTARTFPEFAQLNNILLVRDDRSIHKLVFNGGSYSSSSYQLPDLPAITIKLTPKGSDPGGELEQKLRYTSAIEQGVACGTNPGGLITKTDGEPYAWERSFEPDDLNTLADTIRGTYNKVKGSMEGYTTGYVFLSVAFQLFDGSVTKPSPPPTGAPGR